MESKKEFTETIFQEFLKEIYDSYPGGRENLEADQRFMSLIQPYLHMTEEEMKVAIPNGCYELSGNGMIALTGKGGLIMTILAMQKELKKYGKENG